MSEPQHSLKVFLCYASQDKPVARELAQRLFSEGWINPWLDEKNLLPGQDWRLKIEKAIETSDIVIIFLSSNSVSKEGFVQKELRYAKEIALEKPAETIFLIPLRLDESETPRDLRFYQWADYFGEKKDEAYDFLLKSLRLRYEQKLQNEEEFTHEKDVVQEKNVHTEKTGGSTEKALIEAEEHVRKKQASSESDFQSKTYAGQSSHEIDRLQSEIAELERKFTVAVNKEPDSNEIRQLVADTEVKVGELNDFVNDILIRVIELRTISLRDYYSR
jgi:hypothetical protein